MKKYKIKKNHTREFVNRLVYAINALLVFFSLRKKRKFWGIVYDSVTKQPLDPAIVKLSYIDDQRTETCVTDLGGRYGFLARPGRFKLLAKKTNYTFPSVRVVGDSDGIYTHLYHGEFFEVEDDYEVVAPNIPMDPIKTDWNQEAKLSVLQTSPYRDYLVKTLLAIFFWFGFLLNGLYIAGHYRQQPLASYYIYAGYFSLFLLKALTPEVRLWGKLRQKYFYDSEIFLEVHNPALPGVVFGKTQVLHGGKFFLRANPGRYILVGKRISPEGSVEQLGEVSVRVGNSGVVNSSLRIR